MQPNSSFDLLVGYLRKNSQFDNLVIQGETISYNGRTIDLEGFDVERFINESEKLINDMSTLEIEHVFNIIKLHVDMANMKKRLEEEEAKKMMDNFISNNPSLSRFYVFKNVGNFGDKKSFLKYTDINGNNYVLEGVTHKDFLITYAELQNSGLQITEEQLFRTLASKYKQIKLENYLDAQKRIGVTPEHLSNLKGLEDSNIEHMENHNVVVGNEQYGIYLNNGRVINMGHNKDGDRVIESHPIAASETEEEFNEDKLCKYEVQQMISFEEYKYIITNKEELSGDDIEKITNFETFLFSVVAYKAYLTPELYQIYLGFENFYHYLESVQESTKVIEDTKNRYGSALTKCETIDLTMTKEKVQQLQKQLDNSAKAGYVSALLYVGAVLFVGIVIAVITILAK